MHKVSLKEIFLLKAIQLIMMQKEWLNTFSFKKLPSYVLAKSTKPNPRSLFPTSIPHVMAPLAMGKPMEANDNINDNNDNNNNNNNNNTFLGSGPKGPMYCRTHGGILKCPSFCPSPPWPLGLQVCTLRPDSGPLSPQISPFKPGFSP